MARITPDEFARYASGGSGSTSSSDPTQDASEEQQSTDSAQTDSQQSGDGIVDAIREGFQDSVDRARELAEDQQRQQESTEPEPDTTESGQDAVTDTERPGAGAVEDELVDRADAGESDASDTETEPTQPVDQQQSDSSGPVDRLQDVVDEGVDRAQDIGRDVQETVREEDIDSISDVAGEATERATGDDPTQPVDQQQPTESGQQEPPNKFKGEDFADVVPVEEGTESLGVAGLTAGQIATKYPELYDDPREVVLSSDGPPSIGTNIVETELNVPVGGYRFDPSDESVRERWLESRDERQEYQERYSEQKEAEENLGVRDGEIAIEAPDPFQNRELLSQDIELPAETEQPRQATRELFADRLTRATVEDLAFEPGEITLEETEQGFRPTLSEAAREDLAEYQQTGYRQRFREEYATLIDTRNPNADIGTGDIRIEETEQGLQPRLAPSGEAKLQEVERERQRLIAAQEVEQQIDGVDVEAEDIALFGAEGGGLAPTLTQDIEAEIRQVQRERAAESFSERFDQREITAEDVVFEGGQARLADETQAAIRQDQKEQAAAEFSERYDTDVSTGDIELTDEGARLTTDIDADDGERPAPDLGAIGVDQEREDINLDIERQGTERPQQSQLYQETVQTPTADVSGIGGALSVFDAEGLAATSGETYQGLQTDIVNPAAEAVEDVGGAGAGNIVTGLGRGVTGLSALPAVAYKGAELTGEAAEFTYENPLKAPGAGVDVTTEFVASEAERAQDKPLQYGGEIAGGGLVGYGFGEAAGPALKGTRTGSFLRRIDVGTRGQRRLRTEFRGLLDRDTADLGRESVVGSRLREQADRVSELDFDELIGAERGQLQMGRQRTPETDRDVSDLMGEDIAGTDPDVGEGSRLADAPGGIDESATRMGRTRGGSAERQQARARTEAERRDPSEIGSQEPGFEERYFDPQTGRVITPDIEADLSTRFGLIGAEVGATGQVTAQAQQRADQAQQPQVADETAALTDEATTPALDTQTDTDVDAQALAGFRTLERGQTRLSERLTPETTPDLTPTTTPEFSPETTTTTTTDIDQQLITPEISPDPTPDPTPETPPPRPPEPPIPDLDFDTGDRRQQGVPGRLQAGEFENPALAPGEAYSFDPFEED